MTNFLWSTWRRRDLTLFVASLILTIAGRVADARWIEFAGEVAFAGAMFCWGAAYLESTYEDCDCEEGTK